MSENSIIKIVAIISATLILSLCIIYSFNKDTDASGVILVIGATVIGVIISLNFKAINLKWKKEKDKDSLDISANNNEKSK